MRKRRMQGLLLSQKAVAVKLGVSPSTVSKWERGEGKPRSDKLPAIARLYNCSIEELLEEEEE